MPYMEWIRYEDLRDKFWGIITSHSHDGPLRGYMCQLADMNAIERRYEGTPPAVNDKIKLTGYLYVRRIVRKIPRATLAKKKLDGTFGFDAMKERAKRAAAPPKTKPKTDVKNLTHDDLRYIQCNTLGANDTQLGEMFKILPSMAGRIRRGYVPAHLKSPPAQSLPADTQAGI